jgi:hypothetical protein
MIRPPYAYEWAVLRVVPRVERGEYLNVGVVLVCRQQRFLGARVELDLARLTAFAPFLSATEIEGIAETVALAPRICAGDPGAGPIAALELPQRWHWLVAPASTLVQAGPVHTGFCHDPAATLDRLFAEQVALPDPA